MIVKRVFDLLLVGVGLLLLALPLVVLAWLVRRRLGSPIFFRQIRPGRHGVPFEMVKFRTMTVGADRQLAGIAAAIAMLGYEHWLLKDGDLTKMDAAFFNMNGYISVALLLFTALDVLLVSR